MASPTQQEHVMVDELDLKLRMKAERCHRVYPSTLEEVYSYPRTHSTGFWNTMLHVFWPTIPTHGDMRPEKNHNVSNEILLLIMWRPSRSAWHTVFLAEPGQQKWLNDVRGEVDFPSRQNFTVQQSTAKKEGLNEISELNHS